MFQDYQSMNFASKVLLKKLIQQY